MAHQYYRVEANYAGHVVVLRTANTVDTRTRALNGVGSRAVHLTDAGRAGLAATFGIDAGRDVAVAA